MNPQRAGLTEVALGSYHFAMPVEKVGIKDLKNNLSRWIHRVRQGRRLLVTLRDEVVAEINPPNGRSEAMNPLLAEWVRAGKVQLPRRRRARVPRSPLRSPAGTALALLEEDRRE